ncbi:centrosomal protein of 78 kDa-like [Liolophura sinensis]|uniref:centrosomal protein of 78 kDa-like n=1 Tax=Liolophura sinensis TaxID=3198878 RepID=UPI003158DF52
MIESVQVRQRGAFDFQTHYENLCALQDSCPLPAVKAHLSQGVLDLNGDRLRANDWPPILNTLRINKSLEFVAFRSFYTPQNSDNEKNLAVHRKKMPAIRSKDVTYRLCKALRECMAISPALTCLELQGLPLRERDLTTLTKGLFKNTGLCHVSLEFCHIGDAGLETICRGIKNSTTINSLNLTGCCLSWKGAECLAKVIKHQAMKRHNEAWRDSLRYRRPDLDRMPGIRRITVNNNPLLGDQGAILLAEALKDDLWLKALDLQSCGISSSGARTLLEVLKYNTTVVVLDVRRNPLIDRDVLHSIMEQLMLNCNGQDTEYKWIKAEESGETNKANPKSAVRKRRTKTLNISFGRKTTIRVPLSTARRRTKSAGSANGTTRNITVKPASGLPWRTAARANRHRGFPPELDPRSPSMYDPSNGMIPHHASNPELSVIVGHEDSNEGDTFGELGKLDLEESQINGEIKQIRGVRVELEQLRRLLKEETDARKEAERKNVELSLENKRLKDELVDLRVNRGSILEEDLVLESIEASFRQFHSFLDLLRDAGLGQLITMAGLDQGSMPFGQGSTSFGQRPEGKFNSKSSLHGNKAMNKPILNPSASHPVKTKAQNLFAGDINSAPQVSTSYGSYEEGQAITFGPHGNSGLGNRVNVASSMEDFPDPAMSGVEESYGRNLREMKVDDLYEKLVQDTREVLNTDWESKMAEAQSGGKTKPSKAGGPLKEVSEKSVKSDDGAKTTPVLREPELPLGSVRGEDIHDVADLESMDGGRGTKGDNSAGSNNPGVRREAGQEIEAKDRNVDTPDPKSGHSEANYSMDGFEESYLSERGEVIQDIDLLGSPSPPLQNSDDDDF